MKRIISILFFVLFSFLLLEVGIYLLVRAGVLNIIMPTYSLNAPERFLPERSFIYGHRHLPNSTYEIKKNCLHTHFKFNELGFRDQLPSKRSSKKRVIVLGDSFMEGIGVEEEERLSDLLEKKSGIPHLNFSMGDKGPTQFYTIYDSIASKYDHSAILITLFPANDLIDDDPTIAKTSNSIRPCWLGEYPDYQLSFVPETAPSHKPTSKWKHFLKTHTYTYDALYFLKESLKTLFGKRINYPNVDYFTFNAEQLNRIKYSLLMLQKKANNRPIIFICIPSHLDLMQKEKNANLSIEEPLEEFCKTIGVEFIGLYSSFKNAAEKPEEIFYYSCDSHWNVEGHKLAMNAVLERSPFYKEVYE